MTSCRRMNFLVKSTYLSHHSIFPKKMSDGIRWDTKTKGLPLFHCGDKPIRRICPSFLCQWSSPFSYRVYSLMMFLAFECLFVDYFEKKSVEFIESSQAARKRPCRYLVTTIGGFRNIFTILCMKQFLALFSFPFLLDVGYESPNIQTDSQMIYTRFQMTWQIS